MTEKVELFSELIQASDRIVFFTGAGISTESGIPDFRSPGGFWTKNQPVEFDDFLTSEEARRKSWRQKFAMEDMLAQAVPNKGHHAIASLYGRGKVSAVVTQNIDGLHQVSGIAEEDVIELHGNTTYAKCLSCGQRMALTEAKEIFDEGETPPICPPCGGFVKTATISFGQPMPIREMERAEIAAIECDLLVVVGSSLVVYPAAEIPVIARNSGADLVILNRDETGLDPYASLVLNMEIGETLHAVTKL